MSAPVVKAIALVAQSIWQVLNDADRRVSEIKVLTSDNPYLRELAKAKFSDKPATRKLPADLEKMERWAAECNKKRI